MEENSNTPSTSRSRRQKHDKHGRFAALAKLRESKGIKHKAELTEVNNVYDEVDEKEYSKRVTERQFDDWIVDEGCGYVEDGREIFDDEEGETTGKQASRHHSSSDRKRKGEKEKDENIKEGRKGNIRHMIRNMQTKKKKVEDIKLEDDVVFQTLLQEFEVKQDNPKPAPKISVPINHMQQNGSAYKSVVNIPKPLPAVNFAKPEVKSVAVGKLTSTVQEEIKIKKELVEVETESQIIEDCDSMDFDFSSQDLEMMDIQVDASQATQLSQPAVTVKQDIQVKADKIQIKAENVSFSAENSWGTMTESLKTSTAEADVKPVNGVARPSLEEGNLPTVTLDNGEEVLRMYWWDAYEDPFKQPGVVYLFGKVSLGKNEKDVDTWTSVCLIVRNIEKHVFLLPRQYALVGGKEQMDDPVSLTDVYTEFNTKVARKHKIMEFKSRPVTKNYAFNLPGVPVEAEYLEVVYPGNGPVLPQDLSGETFSRVFGSNTSSLETFLLQRRLKGPCWIDIKGAKRSGNPVSWCKLEVVLQDPDDLSVYTEKIPPPPLVAMTLNLRIAVNPKTMHNEIVMASCLLSPQYPVDHPPPQPAFQSHFCILTRPPDCPWPFNYNTLLGKSSNFTATTLHRVESERALLSLLLTLLFRADPDLLIGHDIANFDLPTLLFRLSAHKVENWSRIGRLKRSGTLQHQAGKNHQTRSAVCGRLVCDVKLSSQELIRARSYDLDTLCQTVLKVPEGQRQVVSVEEVRTSYSSGEALRQLICLSMQDAAFILRIMCELNAIPLALQITNIAGNVMSRTLMGGRSERNEFLLLHAFTEKGYIPPDKVYGKGKNTVMDNDEEESGQVKGNKSRRKKAAYSGGLVLDPKKGFYDNFILLMDFNSLYPSIIQEYNICFTTLINQPKESKTKNEDEEDENDGMEELMASVSAAQAAPPGVLPTEIRKLVESRRLVKGLLATGNLLPEEKMQLNIRQMALKLTANSMYGCLGFAMSRFYAKHLAALVTAKGRDILMHTKTLVEKMGLDVVYGDTDSIMINTRSTSYDEVLKLGFKVKGEVNKLYHNVELEVDGIFKYLLLLKKKKYAAVTISRLPNGSYRTEEEHKGLDIVRRDWAPFASETGRYVLKLVLSDLAPDERLAQLHEKLASLRGRLEKGEVPITELAIAKTLTRSPEQYADKKGLPHVTVAMRLNAKGGRKLKQGDTVHYVICDDGTNVAATQRAYHVDEVKINPSLKVDVEYYLAHQIHPVVSRLVECMDGTNVVRIAECLGLDTANYKAAIKREEEEEDGFKQISQFCLPEEERYKHCDKFKFKCQSITCGADIEMKSAFSEGKDPKPYLEKCSNPECNARPVESLNYLQNCLALAIRSHIAKYYEGWMVCEDPRCNARTRGLANNFYKGLPVCRKCKQGILTPEYSEHDLHQQIYFYRHIFNIAKYPTKGSLSSGIVRTYMMLKEQVDRAINISSYCLVDLTSLFKKLQTKKTATHSTRS